MLPILYLQTKAAFSYRYRVSGFYSESSFSEEELSLFEISFFLLPPLRFIGGIKLYKPEDNLAIIMATPPADDPSIYLYDEIYDDIKKQKKDSGSDR